MSVKRFEGAITDVLRVGLRRLRGWVGGVVRGSGRRWPTTLFWGSYYRKCSRREGLRAGISKC